MNPEDGGRGADVEEKKEEAGVRCVEEHLKRKKNQFSSGQNLTATTATELSESEEIQGVGPSSLEQHL